MRRVIALVLLAALAGCASFEKKPFPDMGDAPPEIAPEPEPEPAARDPEPIPPDPGPPPELPGTWNSVRASGPGSAGVVSVTLSFAADGAYAGSLLLDQDGRRRFAGAEGRWTRSGESLTVVLTDGRSRAWGLRFEGRTLVLSDGEAELRLERRAD